MRARQIAPIALVLGLTVAGFIVARAIARHDARDDSQHRADVAAAQIRARVEQATSLTESLRRYMLDAGGTGVTSDQFARNALRWLSPANFPAAAWLEQVPASRREAYERRLGQPIVTPDERHSVVPPGSRPSYLPATVVSGFPPMDVPGIDMSGEPGIATALARATRLDGVAATPAAAARTGTNGLFLVGPAPNLVDQTLRPGYVVVFVSEPALRAAADTPGVRLAVGASGTGNRQGGKTAHTAFRQAGQRFEVMVPLESVQGAAAVSWIILAAGLVLAGLTAALAVNAGRRAKAQDELDRIFNLSSDVISVADFDEHFTRVNPAVEQVLGYTPQEFLAKRYLDLVHPEDREKTAAEAAGIADGKTTLSFENRYVHKDGSYRVLEWTTTPVVEDGLMYGVARDVTQRRRAEAELERLAGEQAALRRVATLVAEDVPPSELLLAVAREVGTLLGGDFSGIIRYEDDSAISPVVTWAAVGEHPPVPDRWPIEAGDAASMIAETRQPARVNDWTSVPGAMAEYIRSELGVRSSVGSPIVVEGRLWGALAVHSKQRRPLPPDAEARVQNFTELVATAIANTDARAEVARLAQEQEALRHVAELVAHEAPEVEIFGAIAEEIGRLLGADRMRMLRYVGDGSAIVVGNSGDHDAFPLGSRQSLEGESAASLVLRTGRTVRIDDYQTMSGPLAETALSVGVRGAVGTPILVEGRLWGTLVAATTQDRPLPPDTESRLREFTGLMATAIANTEARARVEQLVEEQAALRRVATLVAEESAPAKVFEKVAEEVASVLGDADCSLFRDEGDGTATAVALWGAQLAATMQLGARLPTDGDGVIATVLREGRPCRIGDYSAITGTIAERGRELGIRSAVGCPILVRGRIWGVLGAARYEDEAFPPGTETRIARFAELVATAIANADARAEVGRLAEEQAALRRIATLVAEGAPPSAVLDAVAGEMEALLDADQVALNRFEPGDEMLVLAHRGLDVARTPVGSLVSTAGQSATATVRRTGRPTRVENYEGAEGAIAELARATGLRSSVSAPIVVAGQLWGLITASWKGDQAPPADTEERMAQFAQLLDTAIANTEARAEVERLAEEQAALRRVATLVAQGASPSAVLDAVASEMEQLLCADGVTLNRYEPEEWVVVVAHSGSDPRRVPPGTRLSHRGENVTSLVRRTQRSARMEHPDRAEGALAQLSASPGVRASVGAPIVVDGQLWGVAIANWRGEESPPAATEERMAQFAELLDTAIANADSRDQLAASRARLVTEADDARRRVVRDLHDGAQQRLVHTIVTLKLARRALRQNNGQAESLLGEALENAEQGNAELRELAHGILPALLTRGGLRAGVDAVVSRLSVPVQVELPDDRFSSEIEASAYFIVAEALTNVMKHSHAESAEVKASVENGMLHIEVRDDGIGNADPTGHGLVGLGDRVTALGGQFTIESPPGGGTLVAATLPLAQ